MVFAHSRHLRRADRLGESRERIVQLARPRCQAPRDPSGDCLGVARASLVAHCANAQCGRQCGAQRSASQQRLAQVGGECLRAMARGLRPRPSVRQARLGQHPTGICAVVHELAIRSGAFHDGARSMRALCPASLCVFNVVCDLDVRGGGSDISPTTLWRRCTAARHMHTDGSWNSEPNLRLAGVRAGHGHPPLVTSYGERYPPGAPQHRGPVPGDLYTLRRSSTVPRRWLCSLSPRRCRLSRPTRANSGRTRPRTNWGQTSVDFGANGLETPLAEAAAEVV